MNVDISNEHAQRIRNMASEIAEEYSNDLKPHKLKGFRLHKSLISIVKASALRDSRRSVMDKDIERVKYLSTWMNLQMRPLKLEYPFAKSEEKSSLEKGR